MAPGTRNCPPSCGTLRPTVPRSLVSPPQLTLSEFVLLGLIQEKPRHGYDLETEIERRGLRDWTPLGHSLIYHTLGRIKSRRWASTRSTRGRRGRPAIQYRLTAAGRRMLEGAMRQALEDGALDPVRTELALMFALQFPTKWLRTALQKRRTRVMELRREARKHRRGEPTHLPEASPPAGTPGPARIHDALCDHHDALLSADIAWCERTLKALGRRGRS